MHYCILPINVRLQFQLLKVYRPPSLQDSQSIFSPKRIMMAVQVQQVYSLTYNKTLELRYILQYKLSSKFKLNGLSHISYVLHQKQINQYNKVCLLSSNLQFKQLFKIEVLQMELKTCGYMYSVYYSVYLQSSLYNLCHHLKNTIYSTLLKKCWRISMDILQSSM